MSATTITLRNDRIKSGVAYGAYPQAQAGVPPRPRGTATASANGSSTSTLAFTGLDAGQRYYAIDKPANAVQTLTVDATAGGYRLRRGSDTTEDIAFDAAHADVQTAAESILGTGNVTVSGGPGDEGGTTPYTLTFVGSLAGTAQIPLEVLSGATALSGGGATAAIAVSNPGSPGGTVVVAFTPGD